MQEQNQRTSPWLIAWRVIFTFALIGCIVFIFSNSLQIADVSEGASGRVLGILQGILRHLGLPGAADRLTMHIVRKLAHFCEYLLEGFLLMLCLRVYTRHFFKHVSWPMLGGLLTALTDETIQLFVPERPGPRYLDRLFRCDGRPAGGPHPAGAWPDVHHSLSTSKRGLTQ